MKVLLTLLIMIGGTVGAIGLIILLGWLSMISEKKIVYLKREYKWFDKLTNVFKVIGNILIGLLFVFMLLIIFCSIYIRL